MKKKTTAAVLVAAMLVVTQRLPIRTSHAHAEGEEGHAGEASTPEQPTPQEETVSSEAVHVEQPKAEEKPEVKEEPKVEEKPEVKEEPKAEEKPEVKEEPKAEEKSEVKEEPKAEEKPEVKEEPKAEEKSEVKEEPKAEEKPEVKEEPKAEEKPEVKEEPKAEEKPEATEEPEAEEKPEATEEPKAEPTPEATEAPAETPAPTATPEATEEPEQERQLPAILEQIEREGYAYVKTAGSGVKLYDSERMNRRLGNIDNGQSVLLALDYEEIEENQFAVYVVFGCDGRAMDGYVKLGDLDRQALDGDTFIRDHAGSSVRSDDYPLVNIGYTLKEQQNEEKAEKPKVTAEPKKEEKPEATAEPKQDEEPKAATEPEATEEPETTLAPVETLVPEATAEATATPEITPEPTEEPLNLPPIPTRIERNGYAYVRTAELEVKLYTDANLDNQFASIYEKGALLLTDEYVERPEAKSYALHVYLADENGVVDGYVSLKRILKNPLDSDLESGAESVNGLPVAKTKVHWKKNAALAVKPTATPEPTATPAPTATAEPTETPKPTGVDIATFEGKTSQNTENNGISTLPMGTNRPVVVTDDQPAGDNGISVLPMGTDRPVAVADDQLPTDEMTPTPVIVWPDPDAPASDDKNVDNGIALPILIDEERPVAGVDLPTEGLEPTEIITWPDPGEATPGEAEPEDKDDAQPQEISVHVLIDWPEGKSIPEGAPVWMTAVVTGVNAEEIGYQWQYSSDNENWIDIEGANRQSYEAVMTANNAGGYWRVSVSVPDQKQGDEEA